MGDEISAIEVQYPCCLGHGEVIGPEGKQQCPLCEGYLTVPREVHDRFLEVAAKRLGVGEAG